MICNIIRELTCEEKVRSYHVTTTISKKVRNKINKLPGVADFSFPSWYEICVTIGRAFDWDLNHIDEEIIQILQENFISKNKLDPDDEVSLEIETVKMIGDLGEPTLLTFCPLYCSLKHLHKQNDD